MKKFLFKLSIRATASGSDFRQLNDEALVALGWYKKTDFEIVEARSLHRAVDILVYRYLLFMNIANFHVEAIFIRL